MAVTRIDTGISRRDLLRAGAGFSAALLAGRSLGGARPTPPLRVLCYNIHHGEGTDGRIDLPRLAEVIRSASPDLVALQEVDDKTMRTGGVDQTDELRRLTGLHGRFGKQIDYEGGGYGQAILSRFPITDLLVHWLPGEPDRERRVAVEARIDLDGSELSFVGTHLHHVREEFRVRQAAKLNELFADADRPVILAGDINATPDSEPLALLSREWETASGPSRGTYPSAEPIKTIDYVLFRPRERFRTASAEVIEEPVASDHRPVLAVLEDRRL